MIKKHKLNPVDIKIIDYLRSISPVSAQPVIIAQEINEKKDLVRVYCNRLLKKGEIGRDRNGWFRALYTIDDILKTESPEMRLHGIKLEGIIPETVTEDKDTSFFLLRFKDYSKRYPERCKGSGNREIYRTDYEGRNITFQLSENNLIEISLRSTKYPINYKEFIEFIGQLKGIMGSGLFAYCNLKVVQLGLGKDFKLWEMRGVKSMKLKSFQNAYLQIYQHSDVTRIETHIQHRIELGDAVHILKSMEERLLSQYSRLPDDKEGYK